MKKEIEKGKEENSLVLSLDPLEENALLMAVEHSLEHWVDCEINANEKEWLENQDDLKLAAILRLNEKVKKASKSTA